MALEAINDRSMLDVKFTINSNIYIYFYLVFYDIIYLTKPMFIFVNY